VELAANGTAVDPHDLIIAATALTKGYIVTTRDERSFPKIPGLSYQRW
jgi:predicted nucleic acid-binding protein